MADSAIDKMTDIGFMVDFLTLLLTGQLRIRPLRSHDARDALAECRGTRHRHADERNSRLACHVAQDRRIGRTIAQRFDRGVIARQFG